ncbi:hypothetical protein [Bradyrhizobium sp. CCGE-LA001]|uniref:hypothetical protein n=1 Tax=Bradyrhizobium sp. CCGE-LA001 TaxID=1223566 RepID=UPI001F1E51D2|nr:hypothetical protein [Bradyrhizobium sp. CCGE-LA001]
MIEIDIGHAGLAGFVRVPLMPMAVARPGSADIASFRHRHCGSCPLLSPANLPSQNSLLAALVGADDVRAKLAVPALVNAGHLLLAEDGPAKERIG